MCGKLGGNEVESMQNMMSMAVYLVIADTFDLDVDELDPDFNLQSDLGMDAAMQAQLDHCIMDMFDNFQVDFAHAKTVQDVVEQIARVTLH